MKYVDIIAVVLTKEPLYENKEFSFNGKEYQGKMHIEIKDKSGESIALFLWGINASKANE